MKGIEKSSGGSATPRQKVDWADLRIFLAVAEAGGISAGAKLLGISQPTASLRIQGLEARLGAQLIVRTGNSIALTDAGLSICEHARVMERSAAAIERLVGDQDRQNEGSVRISAPDGVGAFWIAPRLAEFVAENPKISISLDAGLWPHDPLRDNIDLSLQFEENKNLDNVVIPLATFHYAVYAAPSYLEMYGTPRTKAEIAGHRAIHHSAQSRQKDNWAPTTAALQTLWENQIETNSSAAIFFALRAGAGVGLLPTGVSTIAPELVMLGEPAAKVRLFLTYHRDIARIGRVRLLIDWLKEIFDPRQHPWFQDEFVHPTEFRTQGPSLTQLPVSEAGSAKR